MKLAKLIIKSKETRGRIRKKERKKKRRKEKETINITYLAISWEFTEKLIDYREIYL